MEQTIKLLMKHVFLFVPTMCATLTIPPPSISQWVHPRSQAPSQLSLLIIATTIPLHTIQPTVDRRTQLWTPHKPAARVARARAIPAMESALKSSAMLKLVRCPYFSSRLPQQLTFVVLQRAAHTRPPPAPRRARPQSKYTTTVLPATTRTRHILPTAAGELMSR